MINQNLLLAGEDAYNLTRSLRFRSSASAYLTRTPASASNRKTWTWSAWVKRGKLGASQRLLAINGGTDSTYIEFGFSAGDDLAFGSYNNNFRITNQLFRDPSAWYHIVINLDTTQAVGANRVKMYINGVEVTSFRTVYEPPLNTDYAVNLNALTYIGTSNGSVSLLDGYITELNFVDGQQLTASSFGETDVLTGLWKPKKYAGTYGTNGFYLPFTDNSSLSNLTADKSGNSNNWTANNISLTAGATYDSMVDVPTVSALASNYAVWNPLVLFPNTTYQATMSNANMLMTRSGGGQGGAVTTIGVTSGKFYAEMPVTAVGGSVTKLGVMATDNPPSISAGSEYALGDTSASVAYRSNGARLTGGTTTNSWGDTYTTNDVIGVAFDADTGKIWFAKNGTWQASGDPAAGTNQAATLPTAVPFYFSAGGESGISIALNCGQRPFSYTPPTGFVALNTSNLPNSTIVAGNKQMDATTYTGTGASLTVANAGNFQPDLVWFKNRSNAQNNHLMDVNRGGGNILYSNLTNSEDNLGTSWANFTSTGFSIGADSGINNSGQTFVAWQWKAGGAAVTNTAGTISAQVSANTTSGFSVVTYTGNGTGGATVGHGLGVAPSMVIVKRRNGVASWIVNHTSAGTGFLLLENTAAYSSATTYWTTAPTSSLLPTLTSNSEVNASGGTYVAYCFAQVAGYSAFGSYTGNGSADGPFVYTGFRPKYFILKNITSAQSWSVQDTSRSPYNVGSAVLLPNSSSAELTGTDFIDIVSNGFKIRHSSSGNNNNNGDTYIYMAFAENPFKNSLAR